MEPVFALDIGTRVVMGLLMTKEGNGYRIHHAARTEHHQRSMYDGQIHDVEEVVRVVDKVRRDLEAQSGLSLTQVAVAAAGRALRTESAQAAREELLPILWEKPDQLILELEAVQKAMRAVESSQHEDLNFYCVGYSTIDQWVDGVRLNTIVGQRGKKAEVNVVATFLPRLVVDGLLSVLGRAGLEMISLTLEPIAAGMAAVPADMRRINLALVDVGAGTSDIALTKDGTFFTYGMVPIAGDEVTEVISSTYFVDFATAESIKRSLPGKRKTVTVHNFFGEKIRFNIKEVLETIEPVVQTMGESIAQAIVDLNDGKAPQAVILVGGGGLTPMLPSKLADTLQISTARIGIQVRERLKDIVGEESVSGSDVVTPIGIGIAALENRGLHYYSVTVNGMTVSIFELQLATVAEALLAAGIQPRSFLGRPGAALVYTLNGETKIVKGNLGTPALLRVNGEQARLERTLVPNDAVEFEPGQAGKDAQLRLNQVISVAAPKKIYWNGTEEVFSPSLLVKGKPRDPETWVADGDVIEYQGNETVEDFLNTKGFSLYKPNCLRITVNGQERRFPQQREVRLNGETVTSNLLLEDGDHLELHLEELSLGDLDLKAERLLVYLNNTEVYLPPARTRYMSMGEELKAFERVEDGLVLTVEGVPSPPILSELVPYVPEIKEVPPGAKLRLEVNGQTADFSTSLYRGDRVIIEWIKV